MYDEQGELIGLDHNGTQYYYIRNAQNDIIGILDNTLNQIVEYTYDSWRKYYFYYRRQWSRHIAKC